MSIIKQSKVEYDIFLVLLIPILILITKFIPKLSTWISTRFYRLTSKEADQVREIIQIRKEMGAMSMVDEFAKYAKLQRKLNQLTLDLESSGDCRKSIQTKIYRWTMGILSGLVAIIYLSLLGFVGTSTPVFVVPKTWYFPIQSILAYPSEVEGAISIPIWTLLTRNVISVLVKM
ncbi:guided entry of tail-anchored proteins factor 1 [Folsomia candida]|uniref:Guided entry of tail-anchored proteins factor 1 n=1 Tax=Folsomia candida TaxID=158441 RepID=A0A226CUV9_FOLCA|nr:guided entry of tail-anchored proteins factor 1 [Folsomia candida]XP_021967863.1 guided entry of tail-anchored proteins factor 1 [Folsomia candida]OXA36530.1 Tail-anchored protein insertion receptor WRB [Folsomia candida]